MHLAVDPLPLQTETNGSAARTAQPSDDAVLRNAAPGDQRIVDLHDAVAGPHARLVARTPRDDIEDDDRVGGHVEHHADAVELALQRLVHGGHLLGRHIDRMGIELADEQRDDMLRERIHRYRIDVAALDERKGLRELVVGLREPFHQQVAQLRPGRVAAHIDAEKRPRGHAEGQHQRKEYGPFGIVVHHLFLKV